MYCEKCGNEVFENESYCQKCGYKYKEEIAKTTYVTDNKPSTGLVNPAKMIILSIILMLSIIFLPMYNRGLIMGEIYPNDQSVYFWEVMEMVFEESDAFRYYVVDFTMVALVFGVVLLFSSFAKSKIMCILSSVGGAGGMLYFLIKFISQESMEDVFSIDETAICMGFWIALIIFVWCFFEALKSHANT